MFYTQMYKKNEYIIIDFRDTLINLTLIIKLINHIKLDGI